MYEGWVDEGGYWCHYDKLTELSSDFNAGVYISQSGCSTLLLFTDDNLATRLKLNDFFADINNPTREELLMIQLQYGIDLSEPLGVKK